MAYCQSLLYAEHMQERFGKDSIARLLKAYAQGLETEAAIPKVFGMPLAEFEKGYREYLAKVVSSLTPGPTKKELSFAQAERAHREDPENADITAELAKHYFDRGSAAQARRLAEQALRRQQSHPLALYVLAKMELSIGKVDEALKVLKPGLDPEHPHDQVIELLAALYVRRQEYDEAARLYQRGAQANPLDTRWLKGTARVYLLQSDEKRLLGVLQSLAGMDSDDVSVRKKLAELAVKRQDWQQAEHWAREVLYIDVSDIDAHRIRAQAARALGDLPLAISEYEVVVTLAPENIQQKLALAEAYLDARRVNKAREQLDEVLKADPDNPQARQTASES